MLVIDYDDDDRWYAVHRLSAHTSVPHVKHFSKEIVIWHLTLLPGRSWGWSARTCSTHQGSTRWSQEGFWNLFGQCGLFLVPTDFYFFKSRESFGFLFPGNRLDRWWQQQTPLLRSSRPVSISIRNHSISSFSMFTKCAQVTTHECWANFQDVHKKYSLRHYTFTMFTQCFEVLMFTIFPGTTHTRCLRLALCGLWNWYRGRCLLCRIR